MEPVTSPLEAVDAAGAHRTALADAVVVAAWTDHHAEVFAFLVRTTRDPEVAEDLLQEAYLRLTREARAGRTPDNVRAWLYRVGANLAVSRGRRISAALRAVVRMGNAPGAGRNEDAPEAGFLQREGRAALLGVLADLDPGARAALLLSSEGFSGARDRRCDRPVRGRDPHPALSNPHAGPQPARVGGGRPMKPHDTFLELAAIAIDFPLAPADRGRLEQHLAGCPACVRGASAIRGDALAIGALPAVTLPDRRGAEILAAALHPGAIRHPFRLLVLAALLGLMLLGSLAVGAQLMRHPEEDLSVVLPVPTQSAMPDASASAMPDASASPSGVLAVTHGDETGGTWVELVTLKTGAVSTLGLGRDPAWFSDGRLVYACAKAQGENTTICMVDPTQELQPEIASGATQPVPAPDGSLDRGSPRDRSMLARPGSCGRMARTCTGSRRVPSCSGLPTASGSWASPNRRPSRWRSFAPTGAAAARRCLRPATTRPGRPPATGSPTWSSMGRGRSCA